jgi:enterochelin esterase-like enzyme
MKKVCLIGVLVAVLVVTAPGAFCAGEVRHYKVPSRFPEDLPPTKLSIYLPEGYETSGISYPVLYLVHGSGGNDMTFLGSGYVGTTMLDANAATIVDTLTREGKVKPLIVACPDLSMPSASPGEMLSDIVAFADANLRTIPRRESRAIAGHSIGGTQSMMAALRYPETFSTAGGFSMYLTGPEAARLGGLASKHDQRQKSLRIWLYTGTHDQERDAAALQELVNAFRGRGVPVEYTEDDGDHVNRVARRLADFIVFLPTCLEW